MKLATSLPTRFLLKIIIAGSYRPVNHDKGELECQFTPYLILMFLSETSAFAKLSVPDPLLKFVNGRLRVDVNTEVRNLFFLEI